MLFNQGEELVHTCSVSMAKIIEFSFGLLPNPLYSPDFPPTREIFFYFLTLKMATRNKFTSWKDGEDLKGVYADK